MLRRRPTKTLFSMGIFVFIQVALGSPAFAGDPPGPGNGVGCALGNCVVGAFDQGSGPGAVPAASTGQPQSTTQGGNGNADSTSGAGASSTAAPDVCTWQALPIQPAAGNPLWQGNDPSAGTVEYTNCLTTPGGAQVAPYRFVANVAPGAPAVPVAPPPPTPAELAQQAYRELPIPVPSMNFGPDPQRIAVRYWLYLWVGDPGAVSATATVGAVSVTASARLSSVTWSMGAPVSADRLLIPAAPITCQGAGVNPGAVDTTADPAPGSCAFMYQVRSTPERTGGSGTWPVTATATWTISWVASTGETGTLTAPPRVSTTGVQVGAWSSVLVADGFTPPPGR
jgi:hypothetical protein